MTSTDRAEVVRYAAFCDGPSGGNPAGVVLDATGLTDADMQRIAAQVGYSETAFLLPGPDPESPAIRYFSPIAEVLFCGHATIATAIAHAERFGTGVLRLGTAAGVVAVRTEATPTGVLATLTSVEPSLSLIAEPDRRELLDALRLDAVDLDAELPIRIAYAGAHHPIIALVSRHRLATLDYRYEALAALMARRAWTTVAVIHRESPAVFHARNPFPPGGIVEDPATGAAAAALGGYLRMLGLVTAPTGITVHQGTEMGRASLLQVQIPATGGIAVSGRAVGLP
jgi:PhzF family phenazine biosynthesis protein